MCGVVAFIEGVPFIGDRHEGWGGDAEIHFGKAHGAEIGAVAVDDVVPVLKLSGAPFVAQGVGFDGVGDAF